MALTQSDLLRFKLQKIQSDAGEDEVVAFLLALEQNPASVMTSIQNEMTAYKQVQLVNLTTQIAKLNQDLLDLGKIIV